jgi:glyoxylate reductase
MPKIYLTRGIPEPSLRILTEAFGESALSVYPNDDIVSRETLLSAVSDADGVLTMLTERWDAEAYNAAPNLKVLANCAVGYNNIDVDEATKRGIVTTNTPDVLTETTADLAWALIMGASRRLGDAERYLREGKWDAWSPNLMLGNDIYGKTLGIYGIGRIGRAVACRAAGFNMKVIYHSRTPLSVADEAEIGATAVSFDELLAQSDILSVNCPLTPETQGAFGFIEFTKMKNTATFVNTSRGPIVQEEALAKALMSGEIAFAGIDVFEKEPVIHPDLLTAPNAILVPHIGSATLETRTAMASLAAQNIVEVLSGNEAITPIN